MTAERIALIRGRLEAAFEPDELEIVDDSRRHAGHDGARDGRGHFNVRIRSGRFAGKRTVERHRMVYDLLADLMPGAIHALALKTLAPSEWRG